MERMSVVRMAEASPLVGRRRELDAIKHLLEQYRVVTLAGVGGAGKTRLAQRATEDLARVYKDSAWVVELADLQDPDLLGHVVAKAIGLQVPTADFSPEVITDFLADRRALVTLDNCEHLIEACADLISDILASCPGVRVLATSQRALGLVAERVFPVPPLTMPTEGADMPIDALAQYEAVKLFVERASAIQPGFTLSAANASAVVELCRALEGIPLALELAAARTRVLSPQAMVERLEDRYVLLNRGFRGNVPDRQRSLEASVTWTYDLCAPEERTVWASLSVFRGGFSYDAAEAVAGTDLGSADILDVLDSLAERSVVRRDEDAVGPRFRMLETLRLYGERQLLEEGRMDQIRRLHRDYFLAKAGRFEDSWAGPEQPTWLAEINADHANVQAALQYSLEQSESGAALRLISALEPFWITGGFVSEARRWIDLALTEVPSEGLSGLASGLRVAAWFALIQMDVDTANAVKDGLQLLADDSVAQPEIWLAEGLCAGWTGDAAAGIALITGAVDGFLEIGNVATAAFALVVSGLLSGYLGEMAQGRHLLDRAVDLTQSRGETYMRSYALAVLGALTLAEGDLDAADSILGDALRMKSALGDQLGIAIILEFLAWTAMARTQAVRAMTLLGSADTIWAVLGVSMHSLPFFSERRSECEGAGHALLSEADYRQVVRRGAAMHADEAIAFALGQGTAQSPEPEPAKRAALATAIPLTRREREVALLVQEGSSNQAIAERLVVSPRTAEAHVENILRKLGFTSRASIASWAAEHREELG